MECIFILFPLFVYRAQNTNVSASVLLLSRRNDLTARGRKTITKNNAVSAAQLAGRVEESGRREAAKHGNALQQPKIADGGSALARRS